MKCTSFSTDPSFFFCNSARTKAFLRSSSYRHVNPAVGSRIFSSLLRQFNFTNFVIVASLVVSILFCALLFYDYFYLKKLNLHTESVNLRKQEVRTAVADASFLSTNAHPPLSRTSSLASVVHCVDESRTESNGKLDNNATLPLTVAAVNHHLHKRSLSMLDLPQNYINNSDYRKQSEGRDDCSSLSCGVFGSESDMSSWSGYNGDHSLQSDDQYRAIGVNSSSGGSSSEDLLKQNVESYSKNQELLRMIQVISLNEFASEGEQDEDAKKMAEYYRRKIDALKGKVSNL